MNEKSKSQDDFIDPFNCKHKYDLLSHSSGSGPNFGMEKNLRVCLKCGQINISGKNYNAELRHWERFDEVFTIDLAEPVEAIIKQCNYMNTETEGYIPFLTQSKIVTLSSQLKEAREEIERMRSVIDKSVLDGMSKAFNGVIYNSKDN